MGEWIANNLTPLIAIAGTIGTAINGIWVWFANRKNRLLETRIKQLQIDSDRVQLEENSYNLQKIIAKDNAEAYLEAKAEAKANLDAFKTEMQKDLADFKAEKAREFAELKAENEKLNTLLAEAKQMVITHERFIVKQRKYTNYLEGLLTENNIQFNKDEIR